jgi:hypothetical protein
MRVPAALLSLGLAAACARAPYVMRTPFTPPAFLVETPRYVTAEAESDGVARYALRWGAPLDERTALVVMGTDLSRVDLVTGEATVVARAVAQPDWRCIGTRLATDVVFTCASSGRVRGDEFDLHPVRGDEIEGHVLSHTMGDGSPILERRSQFGRFWVSDDGGIGTGSGWDCPRPSRRPPRGRMTYTKCIRSVDGIWRAHFLDTGPTTDLGPDPGIAHSTLELPQRFNPVRWVPRGNGDVAVVVRDIDGDPDRWGLVDPDTDDLHRWSLGVYAADVRAALTGAPNRRDGVEALDEVNTIVDRSWTLTSRWTLLGWGRLANELAAIEILADGTVRPSPYRFTKLRAAGPVALGQSNDGRVWQTLDHGVTWSEVAGPPGAAGAWLPSPPRCTRDGCEPARGCSLVGCDLGDWYRLGWGLR